MKLEYYILVSALVILATAAPAPPPPPPAPATAAPPPNPASTGTPVFLSNDPRRPVAAIAAALDITANQFVACFYGVTPAPQGSTPSPAQVLANKAHLLSCLQASNSAITNDSLDKVMDTYRLK
ncbi:unnamed protein product [Adineta steineri]|uniref:Uncharacterized protein n=1 Tax=Adineta steineri TaxID=433720 RepID=A0A815E2J4_9BILA|nr:unnamed protein product [Adineta steineri]